MRIVTIAVCVLVLTAGCMGNPKFPVTPDGTDIEAAESNQTRVSTPIQPKTPSSTRYDADIDRIEDLIHKKMNKYREQNSLNPLARNKTLDSAARYKSWDMAQRDYFTHQGPNGTKVGVSHIKKSVSCSSIGENLHKAEYINSTSYSNSSLPEDMKIATDAVEALLNSPGHRENALSPNYDSQGIGVFVDENGTVFVTQEFCG